MRFAYLPLWTNPIINSVQLSSYSAPVPYAFVLLFYGWSAPAHWTEVAQRFSPFLGHVWLRICKRPRTYDKTAWVCGWVEVSDLWELSIFFFNIHLKESFYFSSLSLSLSFTMISHAEDQLQQSAPWTIMFGTGTWPWNSRYRDCRCYNTDHICGGHWKARKLLTDEYSSGVYAEILLFHFAATHSVRISNGGYIVSSIFFKGHFPHCYWCGTKIVR